MAQLCSEKLSADPFSVYPFIFRCRHATIPRTLRPGSIWKVARDGGEETLVMEEHELHAGRERSLLYLSQTPVLQSGGDRIQ
jgi:hypothetical protein